MYPATGQGGSQGIEDVGALGILLSRLASKSDVEKRLKVFEELRKERVEIVSATSMLIFGTEKDYVEARPLGKVSRLGINTTEKHMKYLYGLVAIKSERIWRDAKRVQIRYFGRDEEGVG